MVIEFMSKRAGGRRPRFASTTLRPCFRYEATDFKTYASASEFMRCMLLVIVMLASESNSSLRIIRKEGKEEKEKSVEAPNPIEEELKIK
jgi:hypothetical protein